MIKAIVAIDEDRGIAREGQIPWNIPEDHDYFVTMTADAPVIMGSATYQAFNKKPLPDRRNIVVSQHLDSVADGFEIIEDLTAFLADVSDDVWIIGGAGIYDAALPYCDQLYITHIRGNYDCDRFFPEYPDFALQKRQPWQQQNGYDFYYAIYERR